MSYNIGPKIGIDGEKEFRQQIKNINDTYKALEAETKAVVKAFEAQGDEQGKLEALSNQLNKQIDEQKKKQALLEDAVAKATAKFGEESIEATRLRGALYDTQATISNLESELKDTKTQLDKTGDAMEELETDTESASAAALDFGDVLGANLVSDMILDGLREMTSLVKDFAVGSVEAAAEVKAATAQYEQAFGDMHARATASLASISEDTNIASTRMQGSFTKIYSFAKTAGADSAEALTIASRAMVAAADSAAYYDTSIEEATERLQAFLKGNYANDAALGIAATETTRNAKANELYAKSFKELTESQKVDTLLAMVEAGNQASGAIGQAARESDGWENVLGELAEVFRLIQAEAGKPALKKLTPVIQKITKAGYELIEDIDWDEFGETVEGIAEGVIDYGLGIVKAIASVAAGIAAFKISQKVIEFGQLATSFIGVGTQATAAGAAVAASGAVANATPWGAVATVIGLAVGAIVTYAANVKETTNDLYSLRDVTDKLQSSFERSETTYSNAARDISGTAYAAEYYIGKLKNLEKAGLNTAVAHREYEQTVDQLNKLIPELNLQIDEQTGLITTNTDALLADVDAWKKNATVKALQERINEELEAQGEAAAVVLDKRVELNDAIDRHADLSEELSRKQRRNSKITEELLAIQEELSDQTGMAAEEVQRLTERSEALNQEQRQLKPEIEGLKTTLIGYESTQRVLNTEIANSQAVVDSYDAVINRTQSSLDMLNQETVEAAQTTPQLTDAQQAVLTTVENLAASYDEVYASALDALNSQIGMFDEVTMQSDWSTEKIMKNWESQRQAFSNYSANLEKAVEMKLAPELVKQLSDGSTESMQILDKLVNDTGTSVDKLNAAFEETQKAKDTVADSMAWIQGEFASQWDTIVREAKEAGVDIIDGAVIGINSNRWKLENAMKSVSSLSVEAYNEPIGRNSPAKEFTRASEDIIDGAVIGIEKYGDRYFDVMSGLAEYGKDAFLQEKLDLAVSYPDMVAAASSVTNNRSVTHVGGFTIQIYQQPGESATDLAYRVMDIIQTEVEAEGAVFGAK